MFNLNKHYAQIHVFMYAFDALGRASDSIVMFGATICRNVAIKIAEGLCLMLIEERINM